MRIPAEIVEQIRSASNIIEVISDFVSLKKRGSNWIACCPFHAERTPSFAVSQSKGIFKCFGCGKGGDAIGFVMEMEKASYKEALLYLANKYQIALPETKELTTEDLVAEHERESLLALHQFAQEYYTDILHNHEDGQATGLSYCKERGFLAPTIEKFGLGFALPTWEHFVDSAKKRGFSPAILEKSGLVTKREDGHLYDRFRDRFIFPIHSVSGRVIAFGARTFSSDKKVAKYLNSPETPIYHKGSVLYGLFQAKKAVKEKDNCYLVEGYTDVISLHQADICNVVASSGTSLTLEQIRLIKRFTENITVLYDSDSAGIKASLRGIDLLLEEGMNVYALHLPEGHDPDSYINKEGAVAMQEMLKEYTQDFITFKASLFLDEMNNPIRKAEVIRDIVQSIVKIPDEIKQSVYFQQCAKLFDIDESVLVAEARKIQGKLPKVQDKQLVNSLPDKTESVVFSHNIEREAVRLMLLYGKEWVEKDLPLMFFFLQQTEEINFEHSVYKQVQHLMREASKQSHILVPEDLLSHTNQEFSGLVADLLFDDYTLSPNWQKFNVPKFDEKECLPTIVGDTILRLKHLHVEKLMRENDAIMQSINDDDSEKLLECLMVKNTLMGYRKMIGKSLKITIAIG